MTAHRVPLLVKRDLDGFFGLFIDNLVQLLAIVLLCALQCGMTGGDARFVFDRILPGAAVSLLIGNLFYAWQARRLAQRTGRDDVTALPYGINTPSMIVYIFFVMAPVYSRTKNAELAWQMGLVACLGSGVIELAGALVAERVRRHTPRAALLSTLAGIAIGFISMTFALQVFQKPLIAMLPLALILITYFSQSAFPLGLPGGLIAVASGTAAAWLITLIQSRIPDAPAWLTDSAMRPERVGEACAMIGVHWPHWAGGAILDACRTYREDVIGFLSVIVPMGLFNVVGSLQNIESAEAAGDRFDTRSSLAVNGLGTIAAALFGSCFPTTIYIGHPGWKRLGARSGYSTLNGLVMTAVCLFGMVGLIEAVVPTEAGIAIVLWIGIIITAQAFQATPSEHAPAVAIGLFPAIAAWGATLLTGPSGAFAVADGQTIQEFMNRSAEHAVPALVSGFLIHGMLVIERGYILTCMILAAIAAFLIDRKFFSAAWWSLLAAGCAAIGLTHAYQLAGNEIDFLFLFGRVPSDRIAYHAVPVAIGYLLFTVTFFAFGFYHRRRGDVPRIGH